MTTIGLYFYGARFYDPVLSRFTSADSIIPGAGEVQAWDRYAAMGNNPVKYVDPTGHIACEDEDCDSGKRSTKDIPLTERGQAVYGLFAQLKWKSGWWNNEDPGSLTTEAFLGLFILWERGGNPGVEDLLAEAAKNQLWMDTSGHGGHEAYCQGQVCENGAFNFLAAYGGGHTGDRVNGLLNGKPYNPAVSTSENLMAKADMLGKDLTTFDRSRVAYNGNVPYHWGNDEVIYNKVKDTSLGYAPHQIVYRIPDNFVLYTLNQSAYWSKR